ncbi:MAG: hypothetical protein KG075_15205 [Alphaproteobacteria bacterium]|nr:hypothetical protein [Alphaproteobacteria bacterium]
MSAPAIVRAILGRRAGDRGTRWWMRAAEAFRIWHRRSHSRRMLGRIDHRTMRDAGIDPVAAQYGATVLWRHVERRLS